MATWLAFRPTGLALSVALIGTAALAQENAECSQLRATVRAVIQAFDQIGPRLERLEKTPGAAAANEQRQLAGIGIERATAAENALTRLQSLRCHDFAGRPVDWSKMLAESRHVKANFTTASKRR